MSIIYKLLIYYKKQVHFMFYMHIPEHCFLKMGNYKDKDIGLKDRIYHKVCRYYVYV